ncbi:MAG TPA: hypothetical protein VHU80_17400 [Polyangiaceae bacterium]|jgi:hypothetical protein|nr:hypothetical protein [Polyangiaceae bacterium]
MRSSAHGKSAQANLVPTWTGRSPQIACVHDLTVVTVNVNDFARFKDLPVEDWTRVRAR